MPWGVSERVRGVVNVLDLLQDEIVFFERRVGGYVIFLEEKRKFGARLYNGSLEKGLPRNIE